MRRLGCLSWAWVVAAVASGLSTSGRRRQLCTALSEATTKERFEAFVVSESMLDLLLGIDERPARAMAKRIERHARSLDVSVRVDVVGLKAKEALADLVELGIRDPTSEQGEVLVSYDNDDSDDDEQGACTCGDEWSGGGEDGVELARAACPKCGDEAPRRHPRGG